jgi:hypothetical protein
MIPWHNDLPAWVRRARASFPRPVMGVRRNPARFDRCDWCGGTFPAGERQRFGKRFCALSCKRSAENHRRRGYDRIPATGRAFREERGRASAREAIA